MSENFRCIGPDPFDSSAGARLERMGILHPNGEVNIETMRAFVRIFAGLFFDDLCDFYADRQRVNSIMAAFSELASQKECKSIYLLISLQYDAIRKPLPDPISLLAGSISALSLFSIGFVEHLLALMDATGNSEEVCADGQRANPRACLLESG